VSNAAGGGARRVDMRGVVRYQSGRRQCAAEPLDKAQPELARRVQELVRLGYNRQEISNKLKISRYAIDRLRGGTEPEGGVPIRRVRSTR
jgi:hypothetical protein